LLLEPSLGKNISQPKRDVNRQKYITTQEGCQYVDSFSRGLLQERARQVASWYLYSLAFPKFDGKTP